jgi:hypothetical protein
VIILLKISMIWLIKARRMRRAGLVAENRNSFSVLGGKTGVNRRLGILRPRWKGNSKMDLKDTGCEDVDRDTNSSR